MGHRFEGGCHCADLTYVFEASEDLAILGLRACMCRFCRCHGARNTSDPKGAMRFTARYPTSLIRYRFALRTADFLICARCGVYVGAYLPDTSGGWMTVNVNTFNDSPPLDFPIVQHAFDAEDVAARVERRRSSWTPVRSFQI